MQVRKQQLELDLEQQIGFKQEKEYVKEQQLELHGTTDWFQTGKQVKVYILTLLM